MITFWMNKKFTKLFCFFPFSLKKKILFNIISNAKPNQFTVFEYFAISTLLKYFKTLNASNLPKCHRPRHYRRHHRRRLPYHLCPHPPAHCLGVGDSCPIKTVLLNYHENSLNLLYMHIYIQFRKREAERFWKSLWGLYMCMNQISS